jgi:hypothetical protein
MPEPITSPTQEVTALDVALELVATKMALQQIIWNVSGTTSEPDGFAEWVQRSPVPLPADHDREMYGDLGRVSERADAIELEMMEAAGNWLLGIVRDLRDA